MASGLSWPEWSHATSECCSARHGRTSIWTRVKGSQAVCHNWYYWCAFLQPFGISVQTTACFPLKGCPVHLESTAPGVEIQPFHLPWKGCALFIYLFIQYFLLLICLLGSRRCHLYWWYSTLQRLIILWMGMLVTAEYSDFLFLTQFLHLRSLELFKLWKFSEIKNIKMTSLPPPPLFFFQSVVALLPFHSFQPFHIYVTHRDVFVPCRHIPLFNQEPTPAS